MSCSYPLMICVADTSVFGGVPPGFGVWLKPMWLMPSSRTTSLTPVWESTFRLNRASALTPKQAESLRTLLPPIPSSTTLGASAPNLASRRRARKFGQRSLAPSCDAKPSVMESPNATTDPWEGAFLTSTPSRQYQDVGVVVYAAGLTSPV